jgi:hypothetical protein
VATPAALLAVSLDDSFSELTMTPFITRACDFLSAFSSKFFKDGLPVALASAIAALVVGQYSRPAPIVVQAPPPPAVTQAVPAAEKQATPTAPERIVDQLKRDPETNHAAETTPKAAVVHEERKPRPPAPEKVAKLPAKQVPEKRVLAVEAQPVVASAPPAAPAPIASPTATAQPEQRGHNEWVGPLPLPTRVTGTTDRTMDDAPVPPLPVPLPYDAVGARM